MDADRWTLSKYVNTAIHNSASNYRANTHIPLKNAKGNPDHNQNQW